MPIQAPLRALRAATQEAHARVDALAGEWRSRGDYAVYLRAMHHFLGAALAHDGDDALRARRAAIEADLAYCGVVPVAGEAARVPAPTSTHPGRTLGWRYVVAGSTLGARVLLRRAHAAGHACGRGACFLEAHAACDGWSRFLAELDAAPPRGAQLDHACAAAAQAFATVEAAFARARREDIRWTVG